MTQPRPLKTLHIAPTPFFSDRGCHIRIQGIVDALVEQRVGSIVCTYHHGREVSGIHTARIGSIKGYSDTQAGPHPLKYWADLKLLWLAVRLVRSERPDVLHGHLHEGALIGWVVKWLYFWRRIPLVADIQGSLVGELDSYNYFGQSGLLQRLFWAVEYLIVRMPQRLMCSSAAAFAALGERFGVSADRLTLLSDRVNLSRFDRVGSVTRSEFGVLDDCIVVVYSGSLLAGKGIAVLHQTIQRLAAGSPAIRFLLIGYPTEATEAFLAEHDLARFCTLVGRVPYDQLPSYLQIADIGIDPKQADSGEGSGKIVNYMAAGLPVACFDTRNNRELLGDNARFATDVSGEALVQRVTRLIDDPGLRRAEGAANRARVAQHLSWPAGGRIIRTLYDEVLGSATPRSTDVQTGSN